MELVHRLQLSHSYPNRVQIFVKVDKTFRQLDVCFLQKGNKRFHGLYFIFSYDHFDEAYFECSEIIKYLPNNKAYTDLCVQSKQKCLDQ